MPLRILLVSNAPFVNSGYGVTSGHLAKMWRQMGHDVAFFSLYGLEGASLTWEGFPIFGRGHSQWGQDALWSHCQKFGADLVVTNADTHFLSGYGNGPVPWVPICPVMEDPLIGITRNSMDGAFDIVTISRYSQQVLANGGIRAHLIPLPIATDFFHPVPKHAARAMLGIEPGEFVVGSVGMNRGRRKGHDTLIQGFHRFLGEVPNATLMIHTDPRQPDGTNLEDIVNELGLSRKVRFPSPYDAFYGLPASHLVALYNSLDVYAALSLNEGQCLPLWEAFSCGNIAIATNATALTEAMEHADGIALEPHRTRNFARAWSYEVTPEQVFHALMEAYQKWSGGGRQVVSLKNRQWAIENVSTAKVGFRWQDFLWEVEKKIRFTPQSKQITQKPTVAHVATKVQNCGIAAYDRSLRAASGEATIDIEAPDVGAIRSASDIPEAEIVHWQHEPAISPPPQTLDTIFRDLKMRGSSVVVTYHNAVPQLIDNHLKKGLIDAGIVHWPTPGLPSDKRLHILGGMGCPTFHPPRGDMRADIREQCGFSDDDVIVSTFGFASVGRGHSEVLMQMAPWLQGNPQVKMQIIAPQNFLNKQGYDIVHQQIADVVEAYGLHGQVQYLDKYMPDSTVLQRLWMSDVGYLYVPFNTLSSSSAIRFFVSSRLPTVITPSTHFADVRFGVVRTESFSLPETCQEIANLINNPGQREVLRKAHDFTYENYRWPVFAEKIFAIYKAAMENQQ